MTNWNYPVFVVSTQLLYGFPLSFDDAHWKCGTQKNASGRSCQWRLHLSVVISPLKNVLKRTAKCIYGSEFVIPLLDVWSCSIIFLLPSLPNDYDWKLYWNRVYFTLMAPAFFMKYFHIIVNRHLKVTDEGKGSTYMKWHPHFQYAFSNASGFRHKNIESLFNMDISMFRGSPELFFWKITVRTFVTN